MEIPSPKGGIIKELKIKTGDKASQGDLILLLETQSEQPPKKPQKAVSEATSSMASAKNETTAEAQISPDVNLSSTKNTSDSTMVIAAGPSVRRLARELGVDLTLVKGTGRKMRITKENLQAYVKERLNQKNTGAVFNLPANPVIDFSKFGTVESRPLNKIKKLTAVNVHRSWVAIPHVTQFDEADITSLEAFRKTENENHKAVEYKLTILSFVCAVVSKALAAFPQFNASLDSSGEHLIYKKYYNIGIAVETPNGLVVPVIKNVNTLTIKEICQEMTRLSSKARDKGLMPADMSGGCFTISSLGGIGGTAFTPIVNSPEVAILGLSRSAIKPVFENQEFHPRLMLPLSLSYDHRVIDGAEAARFIRFICDGLEDMRKILL